ncbi:hypothetical protein J3459_022487 [Metarhizium acridum]|nr:hypothetical protein J3459_022487 [Metarhizium acridum]
MGAVNLDEVKASLDGSQRRLPKALDQAPDIIDTQLGRRGVVLGKGDRTRTNDLVWPPAVLLGRERLVRGAADPRRQGARLAARVGDLDAGLGVLAVHVVDYPAQRLNLRVLPEPRVLGRDAAARLGGRRLDHDDAGAVERELAQVHEMVVGEVAVVGAVLAHGRHDEAVVQLEGPHAQRLVERRRRRGVRRGAGRGLLRRRVEGDAGLAFVAEVEPGHFEAGRVCGEAVVMRVMRGRDDE